jgi:hypothetical protein
MNTTNIQSAVLALLAAEAANNDLDAAVLNPVLLSNWLSEQIVSASRDAVQFRKDMLRNNSVSASVQSGGELPVNPDL